MKSNQTLIAVIGVALLMAGFAATRDRSPDPADAGQNAGAAPAQTADPAQTPAPEQTDETGIVEKTVETAQEGVSAVGDGLETAAEATENVVEDVVEAAQEGADAAQDAAAAYFGEKPAEQPADATSAAATSDAETAQ